MTRRGKRSASAAYSIPEAGEMVGLSRNGSYEAAKRGEIPPLQFGSKNPKALWDRKLGRTGVLREHGGDDAVANAAMLAGRPK
jgi:hypothetical protein